VQPPSPNTASHIRIYMSRWWWGHYINTLIGPYVLGDVVAASTPPKLEKPAARHAALCVLLYVPFGPPLRNMFYDDFKCATYR